MPIALTNYDVRQHSAPSSREPHGMYICVFPQTCNTRKDHVHCDAPLKPRLKRKIFLCNLDLC